MIALALGTNLGDRLQNLSTAKDLLQKNKFQIALQSNIHETPAAQKIENAQDSWQINFYNQVIAGSFEGSPEELLSICKKIELALGRKKKHCWAPREIDIDILLFNEISYSQENLNIPHKGLLQRPYFLSPLAEIMPQTIVADQSIWQHSKKLDYRLPIWVGILNINPDSFSENGSSIENRLSSLLNNGCHIVDVGAESTRPGAMPIDAKKEIMILKSFFQQYFESIKQSGKKISVDTYHPETADYAIELGVDQINDVSGLSPGMQEVAKQSDIPWVFMHNLGLPADKNKILSKTQAASTQVYHWLQNKLLWIQEQNQPERFIFDPGIGFGKDANQSRDILANLELFKNLNIPIYIGHSRKSFLNGISPCPFSERDIETMAISMDLIKKQVQYLRVHNMEIHSRASLALQAVNK